ncbi:MAG: hypothetical protein ACP5N2_00515 [Candidatus Nanoarchaeia archaeon]
MNLFNSNSKEDLRKVINEQFNEFVNSGKERLVLTLTELSEDDSSFYRKQIPGGWRTFEQAQHTYYSFNLLEDRERELINQEKEYQVVCFVAPNALKEAPYEVHGIEIISRIKSNAMLPKMIPESLFNYCSVKNFFPAQNLEKFADLAFEGKITSEEIKSSAQEANVSYDNLTKKLMEKTSHEREDALRKLELRNEPADEYLFREMRQKISANQRELRYL